MISGASGALSPARRRHCSTCSPRRPTRPCPGLASRHRRASARPLGRGAQGRDLGGPDDVAAPVSAFTGRPVRGLAMSAKSPSTAKCSRVDLKRAPAGQPPRCRSRRAPERPLHVVTVDEQGRYLNDAELEALNAPAQLVGKKVETVYARSDLFERRRLMDDRAADKRSTCWLLIRSGHRRKPQKTPSLLAKPAIRTGPRGSENGWQDRKRLAVRLAEWSARLRFWPSALRRKIRISGRPTGQPRTRFRCGSSIACASPAPHAPSCRPFLLGHALCSHVPSPRRSVNRQIGRSPRIRGTSRRFPSGVPALRVAASSFRSRLHPFLRRRVAGKVLDQVIGAVERSVPAQLQRVVVIVTSTNASRWRGPTPCGTGRWRSGAAAPGAAALSVSAIPRSSTRSSGAAAGRPGTTA